MQKARMLVAAALLAGALTLSAAPSHAAGEAAGPTIQEIVARFDAAQGGIDRISASFKEVKHIALLKDPVIQSGRFFHTKPDKFLWEYTAPESKKLLLNGKSIVAYYPREKRAEEIQTRFTKKIIEYLGLGSALSELADEYDMVLGEANEVPGTDLLVLTPKKRRISKRLAEIRIWLDHKMSQPRQIQYLESDGDSSKITFTDIRINPDIELTKYEIKIPDDFKVTNSISGIFTASSSR